MDDVVKKRIYDSYMEQVAASNISKREMVTTANELEDVRAIYAEKISCFNEKVTEHQNLLLELEDLIELEKTLEQSVDPEIEKQNHKQIDILTESASKIMDSFFAISKENLTDFQNLASEFDEGSMDEKISSAQLELEELKENIEKVKAEYPEIVNLKQIQANDEDQMGCLKKDLKSLQNEFQKKNYRKLLDQISLHNKNIEFLCKETSELDLSVN